MGGGASRHAANPHQNLTYPRSWAELIQWCEEATELASLVGSNKKNASGKEDGRGEEMLFDFRRFVPMVHRTLVSPLPRLPASKSARKNHTETECCKKEICDNVEKNTVKSCSGNTRTSQASSPPNLRGSKGRASPGKIDASGVCVGDADGHLLKGARIMERPPLCRRTFDGWYRRKVFILAERRKSNDIIPSHKPKPHNKTSKTNDNDEPPSNNPPSKHHQDWISTYGVPPSTITLTMPFVSPAPCEFLSMAEFVLALTLLRELKQSLVTGSQGMEAEGPKREIRAISSPDSDDAVPLLSHIPTKHAPMQSVSNKSESTCFLPLHQQPQPPQQLLTELQQDQEYIQRKLQQERERECMVCMDQQVQIVLPCAHPFCGPCAETWFTKQQQHQGGNACPVCRGELSKREFNGEQWQLETWSTNDIAHHVHDIEDRLQSLGRTVGQSCALRSLYKRRFREFLELFPVQ